MFLLEYLVNWYRADLEREFKVVQRSFDTIFTPQQLQIKLVFHFQTDIQFITVDSTKVVSDKDVIEGPRKQLSDLVKERKIQEMGLLIRNEIFSIKKNPLPKDITEAEIMDGECLIPEDLERLTQ